MARRDGVYFFLGCGDIHSSLSGGLLCINTLHIDLRADGHAGTIVRIGLENVYL